MTEFMIGVNIGVVAGAIVGAIVVAVAFVWFLRQPFSPFR